MIIKLRLFKFLAFGMFLVAFGRLAAEEGYTKSTQVTKLLQTTADTAGQVIEYPKSGAPEITGVLVEIPVGGMTGWHSHPSPCVAYVMQGDVEVELETGVRNKFKAGACFAEVRNLKHCGYNTGTVPLKILLFAIGSTGTPISTPVVVK